MAAYSGAVFKYAQRTHWDALMFTIPRVCNSCRAVSAEMQRTGNPRWGEDVLNGREVPASSILDIEEGVNGVCLCDVVFHGVLKRACVLDCVVAALYFLR